MGPSASSASSGALLSTKSSTQSATISLLVAPTAAATGKSSCLLLLTSSHLPKPSYEVAVVENESLQCAHLVGGFSSLAVGSNQRDVAQQHDVFRRSVARRFSSFRPDGTIYGDSSLIINAANATLELR
ncbi:MAG: hypothetical protein L6R38_004050 [Xanthoria sp. 2 TBL-2021]|nr:MAG: hypothetical protein L6R38_004050 [Xanthoria sp. 2 TBL-2021]